MTQITRRTFAKTLVAGSLVSLSNFSRADEPCPTPPPGHINILIHGLFFMQLNSADLQHCKLEIFAPQTSNHVVFAGTFENVAELTADIDWSDPSFGLMGKTPDTTSHIPQEVPPTVLQFTRSDTGVGTLTNSYKRKITLPWPCEIISLRFAPITAYFKPNPSSVVGKNILHFCRDNNPSGNIGSLTCLRYGFAFPPAPGNPIVTNFHIHHQFCSFLGEGVGHVNSSFRESQSLFDMQAMQKFDLEIFPPDSDLPINPGDPGHDVPVEGVSPLRDEISLNEDLDYLSWWDTCSHRFPKIASDLAKRQDAVQKRKLKENRHHRAQSRVLFNLNPANCPTFFVGS